MKDTPLAEQCARALDRWCSLNVATRDVLVAEILAIVRPAIVEECIAVCRENMEAAKAAGAHPGWAEACRNDLIRLKESDRHA